MAKVEKRGPSLWWKCPGCGWEHRVYVEPVPEMQVPWKWNGSLDQPTLEPSVMVTGEFICHVFMRDGKLQFLSDSTCKLSGQTVEMETLV